MDPILVRIGPLAIRWYGLLVVTGVLAAAWLATVEARRRNEDPEHVWNALSLVLILGIIGARLYHVISTSYLTGIGWRYYLQNPIEIIAFWRGGFMGLGIFGAVTGGIIALAIYTYRNKLRFLRWLDIVAPGVLLAQAIGRWGNFFNQELYGRPTDLPWGIYIDPAHRLPGYEQFERFHPNFFYESIWNLTMCLVLLWVARRFAHRLMDGDVFSGYLILYPLGRVWVQYLRVDQWMINGIRFEMVLPAVVAVLAALAIVVRHRRHGPAAPPAANDAPQATAAPPPSATSQGEVCSLPGAGDDRGPSCSLPDHE
ncbi:MAG: prolipoprotein diacylglyceryl transferase [Chloroflexi bacterium]|nr:prolipoprotein diacylglyceryl transferase [Chloroflexota bacterium]